MRSHPNYPGYDITMDGKIYSTKRKKFLSSYTGKDGFVRVTLYQKDKGRVIVYPHKLVAEIYIDNPLSYKFVKHKDDDKSNNNADNLKWSKNKNNHVVDDKEEEIKIKESKILLESKGYTVLTKDQVMNIMKKIRQS
jgi:hypothetical protein